jgi:hypothetical protein
MSRTLKNWNREHPQYVLNEYLEHRKKFLNTISTRDLIAGARKTAEASPPEVGAPKEINNRTIARAFLLHVEEFNYKARWRAHHGWPFDDVHDPELFQRHIDEGRKKIEEAAKLGASPDMLAKYGGLIKEPFDATKIWTPEGKEISRPDFTRLDPEKQDMLRAYNRQRMQALIKCKFAGMIASGALVDIRFHKHAKPLLEEPAEIVESKAYGHKQPVIVDLKHDTPELIEMVKSDDSAGVPDAEKVAIEVRPGDTVESIAGRIAHGMGEVIEFPGKQ